MTSTNLSPEQERFHAWFRNAGYLSHSAAGAYQLTYAGVAWAAWQAGRKDADARIAELEAQVAQLKRDLGHSMGAYCERGESP